jgi:hypothetical protein
VRDWLSSGGVATVRNPDTSTVGVGSAVSIANCNGTDVGEETSAITDRAVGAGAGVYVGASGAGMWRLAVWRAKFPARSQAFTTTS